MQQVQTDLSEYCVDSFDVVVVGSLFAAMEYHMIQDQAPFHIYLEIDELVTNSCQYQATLEFTVHLQIELWYCRKIANARVFSHGESSSGVSTIQVRVNSSSLAVYESSPRWI